MTAFHVQIVLALRKKIAVKNTRKKVCIVRSVQSVKKSRRRIIFLLLFLPYFGYNQSSYNLKFTTSFTKMDFFTGCAIQKQFNRIQPYAQFQFGINRSIFQQRFYPRLTFGCESALSDFEKFNFGPDVSVSFSLLQFNKQAHSYQKVLELYAGYSLNYGKKLKLGQSTKGGLLNEFIPGPKDLNSLRVSTFGYEISIFLTYAL